MHDYRPTSANWREAAAAWLVCLAIGAAAPIYPLAAESVGGTPAEARAAAPAQLCAVGAPPARLPHG